MFGFFTKRRRKKQSEVVDIEALEQDFLGRGGHDSRANELPAWSLELRSPYIKSKDVSSWIGGQPKAPLSFVWPRNVDGTPQHFLAQIDLLTLGSETSTVATPIGLPRQGALLVFIGMKNQYSCHVYSQEEMVGAGQIAMPHDLVEISQHHGFFTEGQTIQFWPVDAVAFLDTGLEGPSTGSNFFYHYKPKTISWAVAALEVNSFNKQVKNEFGESERFLLENASKENLSKYAREQFEHSTLVTRDWGSLINALDDWEQMALSKQSVEPVDQNLHDEMLSYRASFGIGVIKPYIQDMLKKNTYEKVWGQICSDFPQVLDQTDNTPLPVDYRQFIESVITGWRGHRLFGIEPPFGNNWEDLREQDCIISVAADFLLETESEHEYGLSIWCPREDMKNGQYNTGQLVRHCAV